MLHHIIERLTRLECTLVTKEHTQVVQTLNRLSALA